jgi:hypothetical protein
LAAKLRGNVARHNAHLEHNFVDCGSSKRGILSFLVVWYLALSTVADVKNVKPEKALNLAQNLVRKVHEKGATAVPGMLHLLRGRIAECRSSRFSGNITRLTTFNLANSPCVRTREIAQLRD